MGVWRGFHSWFATSFRRMGSGCMFTILRMWQTKCMRKDARSSGSPLLVREDGRGIKVNTPGIPHLVEGGGEVQMTDALHAVLFPREIQPYVN